jgi:hypothetical protein
MSDMSKSTLTTTDQIRERAYKIYLARGCEHGHDVSDWIEAERELTGSGEQQGSGKRKARSLAGYRG